MLPNDASSVIQNAGLLSGVSAVYSGFALTIVVLLIQGMAGESSDSNYDVELGRATIIIFLATFFTSLMATFLYTSTASEIENSARAYLLSMPPGFAFAISSLLLMLGLVLLLGAYRLTYALEPARIILWVAILFSLFFQAFGAGNVAAVIYETPFTALLLRPGFRTALLAPPVASVIVGLSLRWYRYRRSGVAFNPRGFRTFIIFCILLCALSGILSGPISGAPADLFIPFWQIALFVVGFSVLVGWSILYIPASSGNTTGWTRT